MRGNEQAAKKVKTVNEEEENAQDVAMWWMDLKHESFLGDRRNREMKRKGVRLALTPIRSSMRPRHFSMILEMWLNFLPPPYLYVLHPHHIYCGMHLQILYEFSLWRFLILNHTLCTLHVQHLLQSGED